MSRDFKLTTVILDALCENPFRAVCARSVTVGGARSWPRSRTLPTFSPPSCGGEWSAYPSIKRRSEPSAILTASLPWTCFGTCSELEPKAGLPNLSPSLSRPSKRLLVASDTESESRKRELYGAGSEKQGFWKAGARTGSHTGTKQEEAGSGSGCTGWW